VNVTESVGAVWRNWALWSAVAALTLAILRWTTTPSGQCRIHSTTFDWIFLVATPLLILLSLALLWPMRRHRGSLTAALLAVTDVLIFFGAVGAVIGPCMN
jgi:hypothetical protein